MGDETGDGKEREEVEWEGEGGGQLEQKRAVKSRVNDSTQEGRGEQRRAEESRGEQRRAEERNSGQGRGDGRGGGGGWLAI